jgi:hypothetical protein
MGPRWRSTAWAVGAGSLGQIYRLTWLLTLIQQALQAIVCGASNAAAAFAQTAADPLCGALPSATCCRDTTGATGFALQPFGVQQRTDRGRDLIEQLVTFRKVPKAQSARSTGNVLVPLGQACKVAKGWHIVQGFVDGWITERPLQSLQRHNAPPQAMPHAYASRPRLENVNVAHWRGGGGTAIGIGATTRNALVSVILGWLREVVAYYWMVATWYADTAWSFLADWRPTCKPSMAVHRFFLASGPGRRLELRYQCAQGGSLRFVLRHCQQCLL